MRRTFFSPLVADPIRVFIEDSLRQSWQLPTARQPRDLQAVQGVERLLTRV